MARYQKKYDDDDGRTIADMSDLTPSSPFRMKRPVSQNRDPSSEEGPAPQPFTREERRLYVFGALKAALLIGLAFLAGLGLIVWLLTLLW